jgi:hypothetical protein
LRTNDGSQIKLMISIIRIYVYSVCIKLEQVRTNDSYSSSCLSVLMQYTLINHQQIITLCSFAREFLAPFVQVLFSLVFLSITSSIMTESFQQYIRIRTFLGYRPKEILLELQNAFGSHLNNKSTCYLMHMFQSRRWCADLCVCTTMVETFSWCHRQSIGNKSVRLAIELGRTRNSIGLDFEYGRAAYWQRKRTSTTNANQ